MSSKLQIRNLNKEFNGKTVLDNISFDVEDGEFLSILGPSGCGKTTILRILIGLLEPTNGSVLKDGVDITKFHPSQRGMGIVFQNYALFQNMTVLQNVEYALKLNKNTKPTATKKAMQVIEQVGLIDHIHKKPHKLSGGQQQRVAIARTLALNPEIILFDEPMSALDVENRLVLRDEIKNIQEQFGTTMVYITHDQEEAFAMSDRIMVMEKARIEQIDTPINIIHNPANEYVEKFVIDNLTKKIKSLNKFMEYNYE
ncbi:ABC transporter ATP-binding protein [Paludicola sp. MB14-C6]|uniref:ABC transporter ATP-binding protein n=1 Tax=Paludihabitans sp. MB14-C6 TaxID=3070656 RepID=UPI0027DDB986|nr:ABC transporter ATP-binding protein [Paludicola sp. MB14-C6]WMJ22631.1 ABC transporter ATP-binding protein [Paludicola sp. MB14-C6]